MQTQKYKSNIQNVILKKSHENKLTFYKIKYYIFKKQNSK